MVPGFSGPTLGGFNSTDMCVYVWGGPMITAENNGNWLYLGFIAPWLVLNSRFLFKEDGAEGQVTIEKCSGGKNRRL